MYLVRMAIADTETEPAPTRASAQRLRALAHPLRWKLLDILSSEGEATATRCSQLLGESVASCAYHLGILGKYGYLERVPDVTGRERPWREVDQTQDLSAASPELEDQLASVAAVDAFLDHEFEQMKARLRLQSTEPEEWVKASSSGGSTMWVTADELAAIRDEMMALLLRHDERSSDPSLRPAGARHARVFFSTSVRPSQ
jgi:hypothetical protein